jgi:hypothetical protein
MTKTSRAKKFTHDYRSARIYLSLNELLIIPKRGQGSFFILTGEIFDTGNSGLVENTDKNLSLSEKNAIKQSKPSSKMQRVSA